MTPADILLALNITIGILVGVYIGNKRLVGFMWSFFFSLFFNFIVGITITLFSRKTNGKKTYSSKVASTWKSLLTVVFSLLSIASFVIAKFNLEPVYNGVYEVIQWEALRVWVFYGIGFAGTSYYIYLDKRVDGEAKDTYQLVFAKLGRSLNKMSFKIPHISYKPILIMITIVVCLGCALKPSYSMFREFANTPHGGKQKIVFRKSKEFLLYAIYEKSVYNEYDRNSKLISTERYLGYLMNFHPIK